MSRTPLATTILALAMAGCTSTTTIGHADATPDPGVDTRHDPVADTGTDTAPDTPPDTAPDVVPDGPSMCVEPYPPPDGPLVSFTVNDTIRPDWMDVELECTVASVGEEMGNWTIFLSCPSAGGEVESFKIDLLVQPHVWLSVWEGEEVTFRYTAQPIWWVNQWFSLRYSAGDLLIVGGISAEHPTPLETSEYFRPLSIWSRDGICEPEPGGCYDPERLALVVDYGESRTWVLDSTHAWVGEWDDYGVWVNAAMVYTDMRCDDVPGGWFSALVFASGWD